MLRRRAGVGQDGAAARAPHARARRTDRGAPAGGAPAGGAPADDFVRIDAWRPEGDGDGALAIAAWDFPGALMAPQAGNDDENATKLLNAQALFVLCWDVGRASNAELGTDVVRWLNKLSKLPKRAGGFPVVLPVATRATSPWRARASRVARSPTRSRCARRAGLRVLPVFEADARERVPVAGALTSARLLGGAEPLAARLVGALRTAKLFATVGRLLPPSVVATAASSTPRAGRAPTSWRGRARPRRAVAGSREPPFFPSAAPRRAAPRIAIAEAELRSAWAACCEDPAVGVAAAGAFAQGDARRARGRGRRVVSAGSGAAAPRRARAPRRGAALAYFEGVYAPRRASRKLTRWARRGLRRRGTTSRAR